MPSVQAFRLRGSPLPVHGLGPVAHALHPAYTVDLLGHAAAAAAATVKVPPRLEQVDGEDKEPC